MNDRMESSFLIQIFCMMSAEHRSAWLCLRQKIIIAQSDALHSADESNPPLEA